MPKKSPKNRKVPVEEPEQKSFDTMREYYGVPLLLIALTVIGAALRFYNLGFNSLWLDELSTYTYSNNSFTGMWQMMATGTDYSPPVFFFLEHFAIQLLGANETGLRVLPALFGTLTIPAMYFAGKEFVDKYVGIITAGIFAFSPFLLFYSQEARPYALVLFLCAILMWLFIRAMRTGETKDWLYVAVIAAVVFWTHFYAPVFVVSLAVYALWYNRNSLKTMISPIILGAALILPLLFVLIPLFFTHTSHPPTYGMQGFVLIYQAVVQGLGFADYAAVIGITLFILGMFWLVPREPKKAYLLIFLIGVTIIVSLVMSYKMPMLPRYMIFTLIPVSLGIASSYKSIRNITIRESNPMTIAYIMIILFALMAVPYYSNYYQNYTKENWRGISNELEMLTQPGDTVVVVPYYVRGTLGFYYNPIRDKTVYTVGHDIEELAAIQPKEGTKIWYVVTQDINAEDPGGEMVAYLNQYSTMHRNWGSVWIAKGV